MGVNIWFFFNIEWASELIFGFYWFPIVTIGLVLVLLYRANRYNVAARPAFLQHYREFFTRALHEAGSMDEMQLLAGFEGLDSEWSEEFRRLRRVLFTRSVLPGEKPTDPDRGGEEPGSK